MSLRIAFFALLISFLLGGAVLTHYAWPRIQGYFYTEGHQEPVPVQTVKPNPVIPDPALLVERYQSAQQYQPSSEQLAEDVAFNSQQLAQAKQWLDDLDPAQRLIGAEQLGAYPSPEAEKLLLQTLSKEDDQSVRIAAINSLAYMPSLSRAAQKTLIATLQDHNVEVHNAALTTLQVLLVKPDMSPAMLKQTVAALKQTLRAKRTPPDMRESIHDFLLDQFPGT